MDSMRICFYTTGDVKFMATMKRALGIAKPLKTLGWEVAIIAQDCEENKKRIELEASGIEVYYFQKGNALSEIRQKYRLLKIIKPDVVWICALVTRNFIKKGKYKVLIDHSELSSAISDQKLWKKPIMKFLECYSINYDGLICASKYLQKYYSEKTTKPIFYSPYAYNEELINTHPVILEQLIKANGSCKVFVYMGSLVRNYGLYTMLQAAKLLYENRYDFKLYLIGRGRHLQEACTFINDNNLENNIIITGYIEETLLSSYFTLADAFISPLNNTIQDWARCPSKIYMYLPFQKPILTCKIGEPAEIFQNDGFYFNNNSFESLAKIMADVIQDKPQQHFDYNLHSWYERAKEFTKWWIENYNL